ncbi:SH2 domain-containing protein 4A-like [Littorina saxatilis]|uniref:SH2 domain-containing protein n=1 Tax=Littorina saxatilis TaxID=31220 RepID=A0AAN9BB26_9CAEN
MQPKKMGDVGATRGSSLPSLCDGDDVPPFLAPPRPCGLTPASPSQLGERPSYNIMLYKAIQLPFKEHIVVGEFMDCDEISDLLTVPQMEKVRRLRVMDGEYEAAHHLLDCLKRKHGWFDHVLKALAIPRLKQQELIRVFMQAKEKVDKRWHASRRSDVDGGSRSPTTPTRTTTTPIQETSPLQEGQPEAARSPTATSKQHPSQTHRKTPERSMSEPADDKYAYAKVEDPGLLSNSSWFHGSVSRGAAAERLEGKDPGSFLVRRSRDHYTLSLRNEKGMVHMVIDEKADPSGRLFYGLGEYNTIRYSTIPELIKFYSCHPVRVTGDGQTGTCLSKPVSNPLGFI